jgi:hypothetical protein
MHAEPDGLLRSEAYWMLYVFIVVMKLFTLDELNAAIRSYTGWMQGACVCVCVCGRYRFSKHCRAAPPRSQDPSFGL